MNQEEMEKTMEFLLNSHAKFFSDIEELKASQQTTTIQIQALVESQQSLTENVEAMRVEMQGAFQNLIVGNEVTRDLANQMGKLIVNVSQRLAIVEEKTKDL